MKIFRKTMKFYFQPKSMEFIKCPNCGGERLDEIGEVLVCQNCGGCKALS